MADNYFKRLYQQRRGLFWLVSIFCFFTLLLNLTGDEVTPFFVWGMFSEKEIPVAEQEILEIKVNGEAFPYSSKLTNFNRHMLVSPVYYYHKIKQNAEKDPSRTFLEGKLGKYYTTFKPLIESATNDKLELSEFESWFNRYLSRSIGERIDSLEVSILTIHIQGDGITEEVGEEKLFNR